jgi:hypothetical protein
MQGDPETSGPMGQVGNWVFIVFFFFIARGHRCLLGANRQFPGKEKCLLGQLSPFGTSCSLSFNNKIHLKVARKIKKGRRIRRVIEGEYNQCILYECIEISQ